MHAFPPYHVRIEPDWIDYNGHLRDAYYGLIMSHAVDDLMDRVGLDAAYRDRTRCTLYTLELHLHYLHEVKRTDAVDVTTSVLAVDRKRIHVGCRFTCPRIDGALAVGEAMLLHVHQGDAPKSAPLPVDIQALIESVALAPEAAAAWAPASRKIALVRR